MSENEIAKDKLKKAAKQAADRQRRYHAALKEGRKQAQEELPKLSARIAELEALVANKDAQLVELKQQAGAGELSVVTAMSRLSSDARTYFERLRAHEFKNLKGKNAEAAFIAITAHIYNGLAKAEAARAKRRVEPTPAPNLSPVMEAPEHVDMEAINATAPVDPTHYDEHEIEAVEIELKELELIS